VAVAAELARGPRADEGQEDDLMHVVLVALAVPVQVDPEAVAAPAGQPGLERAPRAGGAGPDGPVGPGAVEGGPGDGPIHDFPGRFPVVGCVAVGYHDVWHGLPPHPGARTSGMHARSRTPRGLPGRPRFENQSFTYYYKKSA